MLHEKILGGDDHSPQDEDKCYTEGSESADEKEEATVWKAMEFQEELLQLLVLVVSPSIWVKCCNSIVWFVSYLFLSLTFLSKPLTF